MPSDPCARSPVIEVAGLGKDYRIYANPRDRFVQFFTRRPHYQTHRALHDLNFSVRPGEVLGILGRNGSGKSTLLQLLCGIMQPTLGSCTVHGRMAALLELGAGFNPEFTGLENARLNAAILGLSSREIEARLPEIAEFADIGDFIERPVKLYSSGMYVRLAFAVASCIEPDVLIIDEALAVGDVQFQTKCFRRFEALVAKGSTVLLVTHSTEQVVRHCSRALLLEGGHLIDDGAPRDIANRYLDLMLGTGRERPVERRGATVSEPEADIGVLEERTGYFRSEYRWGEGGATLEDLSMQIADAPGHCVSFLSGTTVEIRLRAHFELARECAVFGFFVKTPDGVTVFGNSTRNAAVYPEPLPVAAGETVRLGFTLELNLGTGSYILSAGVSAEEHGEIVPLDRRYDCLHFEVHNDSGAAGLADLKAVAQRHDH
ncbi:MAG: ABC transporter ATP-binding protein [Gammaproteobacteria bacterium]